MTDKDLPTDQDAPTMDVTGDDSEEQSLPEVSKIPVRGMPSEIGRYKILGVIGQDGNVDVEDLLELIAVWGPCESCAADFDANGMVDIGDLLLLIGAWGSCE